MVEVPSARAASSRARCEIDLSPGTATVPVSGRPPCTTWSDPGPVDRSAAPGAHRAAPAGALAAR